MAPLARRPSIGDCSRRPAGLASAAVAARTESPAPAGAEFVDDDATTATVMRIMMSLTEPVSAQLREAERRPLFRA